MSLDRFILFYCLPSRFAGNNLGSDSRLDSDIELLPRNQLFQFFTHTPAEGNAVVHMSQRRKSVHRFPVQKNIQFNQLARTKIMDMVIKRSIPFRNTFQFVIKIDYDLT